MTTQPEYMAWRCQWQSPEQAAKAAWEENLRLQKRVNDLTKAIHHALDALDDPIFVNNQLWLDPEQTLFNFLEFHLYDRVANGERPLLEIP